MNRRTFLKAAAGITVAGAAGIVIYGRAIEPGTLHVTELEIPIKGLDDRLDGLRAVQLSDFHMGRWFTAAHLEAVIERVLALRPEMVWMTGDYVVSGEDPIPALDAFAEPVRLLQSQIPVYLVLGNHDYVHANTGLVPAALAELGLGNVTNTHARFERSGAVLTIAGIGTVTNGDMQLDAMARALPEDAPVVLLAHEPDTAQWSAPKNQFALQVSGHSHGGQIHLPILGPLILPWMGELYPAGLYRLGSMTLYTNRGLGMSHVPLRINCPPEITLFTLRSAPG